ncbi:S-layer homology domain-containing protein [Paenibacillus lentus]|uniref:S-layer homology domain-containing protein n=1 Tax=Paenibacillus lentus TaxID=1338368 RepID=A0A3Q8S463_9BACL|nr:S-layer homology domain-containing protein [Paenibacillus lentus]AZK45891.1 S-layer homology domain-containing protein [Paenibacillus lentus]
MSNTSYSFKENSHMKDIQGGEKKVMKKILSVALSTAMAFSMFASVAFAANEKLTAQQQFDALKSAGIVNGYPDGTAGLDKSITRAELATIIVKAIDLEPVTGVATYKDQNYTVNHWAAKYIEAATQAGILTGKDAVKQLFGPSDNLTVQELAVVLVKALDLEVPAETNNTATEWAKGYVQAALDKGLIESGINYQANATRAQVVVAAHAIYEANQVPTVASYTVSEAGKVVEFKLSNDEVVKVTLDEALAPNKETEVKFTHNNVEYTHKVTYVTTVAQKVDSVKADNLKEIVVTFDGTVDKASAEQKSNYKIKNVEVDSAKLSDDKTTVTLLLTQTGGSLDNKDETKLEISNVKNEDGTVTFNTEVKFTPVDVTAPTVKEVVGLGTKAFKIVFSEPVQASEATLSSNYEINGGTVGGSVNYVYPNTVIVTANLPVGEHTVAVSDVQDFSDLKIAPIEHKFDVVEDTAAPEIVSVTTNDLEELTIKFNETIKDIEDIYVNTTSNGASSYEIKDDEVKVYLEDPMNYNENTVYVKGARDYSDNKADRDAKVTPTLDSIRPTIIKDKVEKKAGDYIVTLTFSEKVRKADVEDLENYVLKDSNGKIADVDWIDSKGHPEIDVTFNDDENEVKVNLGSDLGDNKEYTLEVAGIGDRAFVKNTMLPQSIKINTANLGDNTLERAWLRDNYVYIQFSTDLATSGEGNALVADKYAVVRDGQRYVYEGKVNIYNSDSVRLDARDFDDIEEIIVDSDEIEVHFIANKEGDIIKTTNGSSVLKEKIVKPEKLFDIKVGDSEVVSTEKVEVKFNAKINSYSKNGFRVNDKTPSSAELSGDKKTLILKFTGSNKLSEAGSYYLDIDKGAASDVFGNKVDEYRNSDLKDKIAPKKKNNNVEVSTVTDAVYFDLTLTENVRVNKGDKYSDAFINDLFEVKDSKDKKYTVKGVSALTGEHANKLRVWVEGPITEGERIRIEFKGGKGAITDDIDGDGNSVESFTANTIYNED